MEDSRNPAAETSIKRKRGRPALTEEQKKGREGKKASVFLKHLIRLLDARPVEDPVLSWCPEGDAFYVKVREGDPRLLAIFQQVYALKRVASFVRQLNFHGFQRVSHGADPQWQCYQDKNGRFQRGMNLDLLQNWPREGVTRQDRIRRLEQRLENMEKHMAERLAALESQVFAPPLRAIQDGSFLVEAAPAAAT